MAKQLLATILKTTSIYATGKTTTGPTPGDTPADFTRLLEMLAGRTHQDLPLMYLLRVAGSARGGGTAESNTNVLPQQPLRPPKDGTTNNCLGCAVAAAGGCERAQPQRLHRKDTDP